MVAVSLKTSSKSALPKDTENIIKQAEEAMAEKKEKEKIISEPIIEKKQSTIQVVNGTDIDPLETQDWLESLSAVISKDGNHRAHFLIKELINKAYREGANIPYTQNTPYINTCLLYTSDAADEGHCVDLGGRRIIKNII